jgi:hypothetical protein
MSEDEPKGQWYPALVLGGETTPQQRARNRDLYQRLKNGVPEAEQSGLRGGPLHQFVFDVPAEIVRIGPRGEVTFRLRPADECYRRLLNCIIDACPIRDEVDDKLAAAESAHDAALGLLREAVPLLAKMADPDKYKPIVPPRELLARIDALLNAKDAAGE